MWKSNEEVMDISDLKSMVCDLLPWAERKCFVTLPIGELAWIIWGSSLII